jgi:pimeloyl-ACP methyl ester carboxylesterase
MNPVLLNVCIGAACTSLTFAVRALIATARTKDYFDKHVREARQLGFDERKVRIRTGLELNVAEGPTGGVPLLLIPGQGCIWQEYAKALPSLIDTYHVLVADVHGHGKSTWNPSDYTAVQIADDMAALIEQTFDGPVVVAGHSSGGLVASLIAARRPDLVRGVLFEDCPFFSTEPDRIAKTYVYLDSWVSAVEFVAQDTERDWVCWYMPRSYWKRLFGPFWKLFTRRVIRQRRKDPTRLPVIRWAGVSINRIWETMSHPFDLRFTCTFADSSWLRGFDQAATLQAVTCPTVFVKATTRHDRQGNLLAALSDEDLARVESLLPDNQTVHVRSSHDVHFARTKQYAEALNAFAHRLQPHGSAWSTNASGAARAGQAGERR